MSSCRERMVCIWVEMSSSLEEMMRWIRLCGEGVGSGGGVAGSVSANS